MIKDGRTAWIYAVEVVGYDLIKIGVSGNPFRRMPELRREAPVRIRKGTPFRMLGAIHGPYSLEHEIQMKFSRYRFRTEWFRAARAIRSLFARHRLESPTARWKRVLREGHW
jgi:hypothetical protein